MKTERIFWGIILVFVGTIFLLENFDVIDFSWGYVWRFWPILLIITGVNILFSRYNNKTGAIIIGIVTIIGLGLMTYKGLERNPYGSEERWFDDSSTENLSSESTYTEDYEDRFTHAKLDISGGANYFESHQATERLFEAHLSETKNNYVLKKTDADSLVNLSFKSGGAKGFRFEEESFGKVKMMLSPLPIWDIHLKMGAGEANFDFKDFKVKKIDLKGGAAEFNLTLGDLMDTVNVNAETGIAAVKIKIPENVGCVIKNSSGLSSKHFEGFTEKGKGSYETPNFNTSAKKIYIVLKGGLSDLQVTRYD
jgi:hypothetical protein